MSKKSEWPAKLRVDIEPEGLKRVVEEGRLMEFVHVFSTLASEHIKVKLVDEIAKASVGLTQVGKGISIEVGFFIDDKYGTGGPPIPKPPPSSQLSVGLEQLFRQIARQEFESMK